MLSHLGPIGIVGACIFIFTFTFILIFIFIFIFLFKIDHPVEGMLHSGS